MSSQKYTPEQVKFLAENVEACDFRRLKKEFNQLFGLNASVAALKALARRYGFDNGIKSEENKYGPAQFKKGQKPWNYKPIGAECISRDGYVFVKVSDSKSSRNWRAKHKVIWEAEHGPIPSGHVLVFADGDRSHVELNNLILVTKEQMARMNYNHLLREDPALTRSGVIVADIIIKCAELSKSRNSKKEATPHD